MRLNKDNVINAFCIFGLVTFVCVILVLVLKLFFGQEIDIGFIKDIFSIGSTLAAALIAVALFSDWKEHAKHDLSKQNIEDILKVLSISKRNLRTVITTLKDTYNIENYAIYKERYKNLDFTDNSNALTELDYRFKILDDIYKNKFNFFNKFADIDRIFYYLNQMFTELSKSYNDYYEILNDELRKLPPSRLLTWNYDYEIQDYNHIGIDKEKLNFDINKVLKISSSEIGFTVYKNPQEDYFYDNPESMIDDCIKRIESIENILISEILPKE
ncbi:hypothetical protein [Acinetobacter soli]|uniref:hypothetical protein n=1 Tax=Acinetobacter soli TaxID=487316 RepID=UPI00125E3600|nr:hypothetical protein [Acinetobacter soli]